MFATTYLVIDYVYFASLGCILGMFEALLRADYLL
jgi:hypothetical protein